MLIVDCESMVAERDICRDTANQYRLSVRSFGEFLSRAAKRKDLTEPKVNGWLSELQPKLTPETLRGRRAGLLCVWNWLSGLGLVPCYNPRRLRPVRRIEKAVVAWSTDDVRLLLQAAASVEGHLRSGVAARDLLRAWVLIAYETGLRQGDILNLSVDQVTGNMIQLVQRKTGKPHCCRISDETLLALKKISVPGSATIFGLKKNGARHWELTLFRQAELLGFSRRRRQGLGTLRKTHGTEICKKSGLSDAAFSLGHVSGSTIARRHYVQPDAMGVPVSPPPILGVGDYGQIGLGASDCRNRRGA